ncbi:hypothetical protein MWU59_12480 [Flavobacteriaceae bacterium F08102]|nr:hypothetical protein [Flavobacteriaceae bacterium F08102]
MGNYYVNKIEQKNGDHEVHEEGCTWMPTIDNRMYLGNFFNCAFAVNKAKQYYSQVNGCYYCSKDCHTS